MINAVRRNATTAYWLFVLAGAGPLVIGIAKLVPMSTGTAGGIGLMVLVPLTMASFAAMIAGTIRTIRLGAPWRLVILSLLSIAYIAAFFLSDSEVLPRWLNRILPLVLGVSIIATATYGLYRARSARSPTSAD